MQIDDQPFVRFWWVFVVGSVLAWAIMMLASDGFPIVELELAGSVERADAVIADADLDAVRASIYWDFLFLAFYAPALYLGSLWAGRHFDSERIQGIARAIACGALVAGAFDIVENLAMLGYLNGWGGWDGWPALSAIMAIPKFALVVVAILWILAGVGMAGARRLRPR